LEDEAYRQAARKARAPFRAPETRLSNLGQMRGSVGRRGTEGLLRKPKSRLVNPLCKPAFRDYAVYPGLAKQCSSGIAAQPRAANRPAPLPVRSESNLGRAKAWERGELCGRRVLCDRVSRLWRRPLSRGRSEQSERWSPVLGVLARVTSLSSLLPPPPPRAGCRERPGHRHLSGCRCAGDRSVCPGDRWPCCR